MAQIELKNINKQFGTNAPIIQNLNISVNNGEFLVLVGPSGCGKSTTLRMIAGLESCSSGEIYIEDRLVNNIPPKDRDIAMVFQNYALYPHMTVFENMAFGLKLRKYDKNDIDKRVNEAAEILEITNLLNRKPKQLSGGQRQRVALGRAIVRKPKVFLFDEPLSNLDAKLRVQMRTEIKKLHSQLGITMIYVTHDQVEAMTMGSRIAVMKDGDIHQLDSPLNIYKRPEDLFVASFIGSPAMNFISVKLIENKLVNEESDIDISMPKLLKDAKEKDFVIGIRPEEFSVTKKNENDIKIQATIELVEPLGSESIIYLKAGNNSLVCVAKDFIPEAINDSTISIYAILSKIHIFSTATTKRIQS